MAKRLIRLGAEISIIYNYYSYDKLKEIGYETSPANDETIVEELLQAESQLRRQIYKEDNPYMKMSNGKKSKVPAPPVGFLNPTGIKKCNKIPTVNAVPYPIHL